MERPYEQAYLEAFDTYSDALFRHARLRVNTREKAVDITQETFVKAWDYIAKGNEVQHWKSFLFRTLHNLIIDEYRRKREHSLDAILEDEKLVSAEALLADGSRDEREDHFDTELQVERVRAEIDNLPEQQRTVVTLRYFEGFSPKEIADILAVSENVVSVRIHRGVAALKKRCTPSPDL